MTEAENTVNVHFDKLDPPHEALFNGVYLPVESVKILEKAIQKYVDVGPVRGVRSACLQVFVWETIAVMLKEIASMLKENTIVPMSDLSEKTIIEMRNICVDLQEVFGCNLKFMSAAVERLVEFLNAEKELAAKKIELEEAKQKMEDLKRELASAEDNEKRLQSEDEACHKKCSDVTELVSKSMSEIQEGLPKAHDHVIATVDGQIRK